jgi:RNA polymerase sigma-70 factor, ECF subfamily
MHWPSVRSASRRCWRWDEALNQLTEVNPRQARVVELRYFGGLSVEQIAAVLGIAARSVKRDWALARTWVFNALQ